MNYDDLSFANQQLAGMLKAGIPIEGALRQLCATMKHGSLRDEFQKLEADLSQGVPLTKALDQRSLPKLYLQMVKVGVQSNNLPAVLILLADYYRRMNLLWTRLKGVMVYPFLVLLAAFALSIFILFIYRRLELGMTINFFAEIWRNSPSVMYAVRHAVMSVGMFLPAVVLGLAVAGGFVIGLSPKLRQRVCWRLPGFKEARLANFASALGLMLKSGCSVGDALDLLRQLEKDSPFGPDLASWTQRLAEGKTRFADMAAQSKAIPPLFFWLMSADGEDWEAGLARAAEVYYTRAMHRTELAIHAALPVSVLLLGAMVAIQLSCVLGGPATQMMELLSSMGDM